MKYLCPCVKHGEMEESMKVVQLGNSSILCDGFSPSYLIDNRIIVDVPNGIVKHMRRNDVLINKLNLILITHFHGDHFFDLPFLFLELGMKEKKDYETTILIPKNGQKLITKLFEIAFPEDYRRVLYNCNLKFVEISDGFKYFYNEYLIRVYSMKHGDIDAYGYTVEYHSKTVGFSGDTGECPGVIKLINNSDLCFIDTSFEKSSKNHLGFDFYINNQIKFPKKTIIPTHMSERVKEIYELNTDISLENIHEFNLE